MSAMTMVPIGDLLSITWLAHRTCCHKRHPLALWHVSLHHALERTFGTTPGQLKTNRSLRPSTSVTPLCVWRVSGTAFPPSTPNATTASKNHHTLKKNFRDLTARRYVP